jgi:hypothetical protein
MHLSILASFNPVSFDFFTDVTITNTFISDVKPCNMVEVYQRPSKTSVSFKHIPLRRTPEDSTITDDVALLNTIYFPPGANPHLPTKAFKLRINHGSYDI